MPQDHATDKLADENTFIDVPCLICGGSQLVTIASEADIEAELRLVQKFHQQRMATIRQGGACRPRRVYSGLPDPCGGVPGMWIYL